jgi:hypothetical protein
MRFVLGVLVMIPAVVLVTAALRGRAQVRSCCSVDAQHDRRMAAAFADDDAAADALPPAR